MTDDEEDTDPGVRTIIGYIGTVPPAITMAQARAGRPVLIQPRRAKRIPLEWGIPELSLVLTPKKKP